MPNNTYVFQHCDKKRAPIVITKCKNLHSAYHLLGIKLGWTWDFDAVSDKEQSSETRPDIVDTLPEGMQTA